MSLRRPPQQHTIDDARNWHSAMVEAMAAHRASVLDSLHRETVAAGTRFFGLTRDEVDLLFDADRQELDAMTILSLMASAEATIREDYLDRIARRLKDSLSAAYIALHRSLPAAQRRRPLLDEHVLEAMRNSGQVAPHLIGDFRDALRLRHWLAHGRYWTVDLGRNSYAPDDIYRVVHALITAVPAR